MEDAISETRLVQSNVKLDPSVKRALRLLAADEGRTQADIVTDAVRLYQQHRRSRRGVRVPTRAASR